ncbi:MAG: hypothetical protein HY000_27360 [Planctomycetes bacterium]|nr:hypothetical protein [Planctomycetota bacterium]
MRTLLLAVLLAALGFGWLARHLKESRERVALIADLDKAGIYVWQYEPTPLGRCIRVLPTAAENWIRMHLGDSLLSGPSAISAFHIREDQVPYIVERLSHFPTLRTVNLLHGQLSEETAERIRKALPDAEVAVDQTIGVWAGD